MKKKSLILLFIILPFLLIASDASVDNAESFFLSLKKRDYVSSFQLLTIKSRDTIVSEIVDSLNGKNLNFSKKDVYEDFEKGGELSRSYWDAFLRNFNPDLALNESKWNLLNCDENYCEISIHYKKSSRPAILKMYKQSNVWRVGLVESFWTRKK